MIGQGPSRRGNAFQQMVGWLDIYTPADNVIASFQQVGLRFGNAVDNMSFQFLGTGLATFNGPVQVLQTIRVGGTASIQEALSVYGTGGLGSANAGYIAFRDSGNNRTGYIGDAAPGNSDIYIASDSGGVQIAATGGVQFNAQSSSIAIGNSTTNTSFTFLGTGAGTVNGPWTFTAPAGSSAITMFGAPQNWTANIFGSSSANQSFGLLVTAGTSSADYVAYFENRSGTAVFGFIRGDGSTGFGPNSNLQINNSGTTVLANTANTVPNLVILGSFGASPFQVASASAASSNAADALITRTASTANVIALGPNLELQDTGANTASLLQHSGGQTEIWQLNGGVWSQIFRCLSSHQVQVPDDGGTLQTIGWRGTPLNTQTSTYTLQLSDRGKTINCSASITININAGLFSAGDVVSIMAGNGVTISIVQSAVTLQWAGNGATTGTRTLTGAGIATLVFFNSSVALISGVGLT